LEAVQVSTETREERISSKARRREWIQACAIATLFLGVIVAWGWACIVGINS
jgi:hypothetical protein